jgi:transposase
LKTIRTKKMKFVNEKTLIVAVDIGKVSNQGYGRCPNGVEVKPFEFFNNGEGFKKFWERIWQAKETYHLETVVVGFEFTGPYGEPLVQFLSKRPVRLVQVNPMHTKRLKELEGNSPEKTDRKDPKVIADIMAFDPGPRARRAKKDRSLESAAKFNSASFSGVSAGDEGS